MDTLLKALDNASAPDRDSYRPVFFRLSIPDDRARLEELLKKEARIVVHDDLHGQLMELVRTLNPSLKFSKDELSTAALEHLKGSEPREYGVWVYYPWSFRLVHLLDEAEFANVRTDRNRNKITTEEQAVLATKKVGVIGLSVGQSVSLVMASERSFGELRLADFDTLELSNLNRIRSGADHLGLNKAVNVAREIAQIDPFLGVTCFLDGLTKANMDSFFKDGGDLDILIEECDSVDIKILARQKAKSMGLPVVMDMSDRGCIDIERFDLEPDRKLMHGWIEHLDLEAAGRPMTNEEKIPYMLPIVGVETLSPRLKASVIELGHTVTTWPQLASSVALGGAAVADISRRILLGATIGSGRTFVDLDELFPADTSAQLPDPRKQVFNEREILERICSMLPQNGHALPDELFEELSMAGALAPSAGNMQPWRFMSHGDGLLVLHHLPSSASVWDPDNLIAQIALGTCIENISLRASQLGHDASVSYYPKKDLPEVVASISFQLTETPDKSSNGDLADWIGMRCTDRTLRGPAPEVPHQLAAALHQVPSIPGCEAHIISDKVRLGLLGAICGEVEKLRVMNPIGHTEFFKHELRWTRSEVERTNDGLDIDTLEMTENDIAGLRISADPHTMALVDEWGGGKGYERFSKRALGSASAVVLISIERNGARERLAGGRAVERFWLAANKAGLSVHPISAPIFLCHAARVGGPGIRPKEITALSSIEERLSDLWSIPGRTPLFMLRVSPGGSPSARSLRKPLSELILRSPIIA